ncbi:hypothetical protein ACF1AX_21260 [Streptomyces sp. NPDC014802]|uniref:Uncharacterized protein n=1 Tax=Streptomyces phage Thestral TaxID=2301715 RepID=A0A385E0G5_9CAUD|nr:hypothetical protein KGG90_gp43 [Streptomyces phage Thestral]AXQ62367.1 hypothetical protein SEA_TRVXSCOTT_41 [Streptomyces phage TrvxScott]AXQ65240.1 hypothetical protein SEA_THESTRAL_43 [Streptomyces phage Thestral]QAY15700.1 hypothetical protein SEA_BOWDEN_42 [Streptomyces phage Bowden]QAY15865.1 hypothetical protein SEA_TINABELCHER_42 [Streptomyces phage TinaBelcher]
MSAEEEFEEFEVRTEPEVVDHFSNVKRAASIVGDLRASLRLEGFNREETFELVQMYWASELGAFD